MDDNRSAEATGDGADGPPSRAMSRNRAARAAGVARVRRLPGTDPVPGVPPVPRVLADAVDPDTPFRRSEPRAADADPDLGWSWPMPPPPAVGPLPSPPPPRPLVPSGSSRRRRRAVPGQDLGDAWPASPPSEADAWQLAVDDLVGTPAPLAAPQRRTGPWRAAVAAVALLAVAVLAGLALSEEQADTVVDATPPASLGEQPAVELEADAP